MAQTFPGCRLEASHQLTSQKRKSPRARSDDVGSKPTWCFAKPVTRVFFADDSLGAFVGDTISPWLYVLNADGNWANNATLTFSSSAPSIATAFSTYQCCVRIAAVGEGRAVITVTAERISDSLLVIVARR